MASTISFGDENHGIQGGIFNGPVSAAFYLPPERRETPPLPDIVIPFPRDADFVERGTTLDQLQQRCAAPDARAALVGLGGVGKSQLAIEHAYRTRERSHETWVFWVHASNAARFEQSLRKIADSVKITGREDPQANIFKLVHDWLCGCKHGWLLVLDNVDDARFLLDCPTASPKTSSEPLCAYLPHCERGSILVTTRNEEAALKLVEWRDIVHVEPMDEAEGLAPFEKKLGPQANNGDAAKLATELEYMPLAIVQAAAYILRRASRCSVAKYLDEYRKSERKQTSLLNYDEGHLRRDREAKNSIIITWQISFEYIQQTRSSAGDLLSLMSLFDRQGIPEDLLRPHTKRQEAQTNQTENVEDNRDSDLEDNISQSSAGDGEFEDDVVMLQNFCFISTNASGTMFEMHALVQLATRKWLEKTCKLEQWKQEFVSNLCAAFPTAEYENWAACRRLYAHAKAAMEQRPEGELPLTEWATLLYRAAWYAVQRGNAADSERLALKSMRARRGILSEKHEDTLSSMGMVGLAYSLAGRWREAADIEFKKMEGSKTVLGPTHPNTLSSMANLASTYRNQGRWDDAEKLQVQVMETRKTKLGADHPSTLSSMANLASTYWNQGRWDDGEKLFVQVMETRKMKLGADHPDTLTSIANLASTYWKQGRWDDAEKLEVQVVETRKTVLGSTHPDTLTSIANLASTYRNQGRWDEAEKLDVQVMETRKTKLGADHPDTLTSMANLAFTWKAQGRSAEATALMRQCVQQRQQVLKAGHPDLRSSLAALEQWEEERVDANLERTLKDMLHT